MNHWKETWNKRNNKIQLTDNVFDMFCKLKKADGYDTHTEPGYYEALFESWKWTKEELERNGIRIDSVYEVGYGAGVNLYLFQNLLNIKKVGGVDYAKPLIEIAEQVLTEPELACKEALEIETFPNYDLVLSEGVFIYFQDVSYGMQVFEKMYEKAAKAVVIKDVYDLEKKEACMAARRACEANYDKRYQGLEKTFYPREAFIKFAEERNCKYKMAEPQNEHYWNNDFVFDFYLYK